MKTMHATINSSKKLVEFSALRAKHHKFYYIIINNFSSVFFRERTEFEKSEIFADNPSPKICSKTLFRHKRFSKLFLILS